ncbi:IS3 family transposase [Bacillus albus]
MKREKYYFKYDAFEELSQAIDEYIQFYNYDIPKTTKQPKPNGILRKFLL